MDHINKINSYFKKCFDGAKSFELARKTSDIPSRVSDLITKFIPQELSDYLKSANYKVGGSVGKGFRAETPWIAILDKDVELYNDLKHRANHPEGKKRAFYMGLTKEMFEKLDELCEKLSAVVSKQA